MRRLLAPILAAALAGSPMAAQAAERAPATFAEGEQLVGNPWIPWVIALAVAAAIVVIVADDDGDEPVSP